MIKVSCKRPYLSFILLLIIIGFSFSCGKEVKKEKYVIGFSQCIGSDQWRKTMLAEVKREMSFHPEATLIYEEANGNSQTQIEQVRRLLQQNIDILLISPNEARPLTPIVEEAYKKGIPVIVIDRKITSELYTAYVGADNFEIGRIAGEYIAKRLNFKGNIAEVMGLPGSSPAIERQRGFYKAIKNYPEIKISPQLYGNWLKEKSREVIEQNINHIKNTEAIFAHNDQMALGASEILKQHQINNIKIVGVDALPGTNNGLGFVSTRLLDASILYPTGGKEAIRTAFSILKNKPFNKNILLKTLAIDSTNAYLMQMQEDRMQSQQEDIERQQLMLADQQRVYKNQQTVLNILVVSLVLAVIFGGIAFYSLSENWKNNKRLEIQNREITKNEQRLREMSQQAAQATEAKFNFFTQISHEFRTPLTLILTPVQELISAGRLTETDKNQLDLVQKNALRLLRMVNQLIDLRKVEYEKMKLQCSEQDIVKFIKEITASFQNLALKRKITLKVSSSQKEIKIWIDTNLFDKVIFNLLSNAFKFTADGGEIILSIEKDINNERLNIKVEDNGCGMSEEIAAHAFDLFFQGERSSLQQGSGLGLSLSKEIVEAHKGSISLKSEKNKGAVFTIELLLGDNHLTSEEKNMSTAATLVDYKDPQIYITELEAPSRNVGATHQISIVKEKSILIIEDNIDLLELLKQKLDTEYEVFTATDGEKGIQEAFEKVPDLIISDIVMPSLSGIEVVKTLKNDIRASHIPIILLTARDNETQRIEGIQTLADAYLNKPFTFPVLQETIKNLLENRDLLRSRFISELPTEGKAVINKLDKKFMNDFSSIVEANLGNETFSIEDICQQIGISRIQLYRKVKVLFDCNVAEYILNRRLQKAKHLLSGNDMSIAEITYNIGFSSPTYFSTVFKTKYGCTPTDFRKTNTAG